MVSAIVQEDIREKREDPVCQGAGIDIEVSSSGSEWDVMSEGSHWSSIRPPNQLHGCKRTASPALPSPLGTSGECNFASRETPEGSLTSSRSVAIGRL